MDSFLRGRKTCCPCAPLLRVLFLCINNNKLTYGTSLTNLAKWKLSRWWNTKVILCLVTTNETAKCIPETNMQTVDKFSQIVMSR